MKKIFLTIFLGFFLFSCSENKEIKELKKEISELKQIIEQQKDYNNNIYCSIAVNSFLSSRNTHFHNLDTKAEDFFYSKKENKCIALIRYLDRYYIYKFGKEGFDLPDISPINDTEAIKKMSEFRK